MKFKIEVLDKEIELTPEIQLYSVKDFMGKQMQGLAITLVFNNPETNLPEIYGVITKSFGEFIGMKNCAYIDLNNCPYAEQLLKDGIATDTGFTKESGFCKYPLWEFKEDFLKEHGAENYFRYSNEYDQYMKEVGL